MKKKEVRDYYDEYSTRQVAIGINARHKSIHKGLVKAGLKSHHHVLEIGCGIGTQTQLLAKYTTKGKITAVDLSPKSIEIAKKRLSKFPQIELLAADATTFDFQDQYDVVLLPDVIEHIPIEKHKQLFQAIDRVLKKDGFVYINIPDPYYLQWCHTHRKDALQIIDQPIYPEAIAENMKDTDLRIAEAKSYSIWIHEQDYMYYVLKKKPLDFHDIPMKPNFFDKVKYKLKHFGKNK